MNNAVITMAAVWVFVSLPGARFLISQQRPDFSGEWVLKTPPESAPEVPIELVVSQSDSTITIERVFADRKASEIHRLRIGGTVGARGETAFKGVMWFGDRLMFHEEARSGLSGTNEKYFERGEDWWLEDDGLLTVEIRIRQSGTPRTTLTLKYAKRSKPRAPGVGAGRVD